MRCRFVPDAVQFGSGPRRAPTLPAPGLGQFLVVTTGLGCRHFPMTAINGSAGMANDGLTRICSTGTKCLLFSGRELRREQERRIKSEQRSQKPSLARRNTGFGG